MSPLTVRDRAHTRGVMKSSLVSKHTTCASLEKHYEHIRTLGKGGYGQVDLVRERSSGQERVCKSVNTAGLCPAILELMKKEIELLCSLDHPGVVKLFEYAEDVPQQRLLLILEYLPGGGCDALTLAGEPLAEELVGRLIYQLLVSLDYCHSQGIAHRDVKPENMMLTREASIEGAPNCKLIDFGLARRCHPGKDICVGTPPYMPPEMIRFEPHTSKCDIWSAGVSAFELLTGKRPFGTPAPEDGARYGIRQPVFERIKKFRNFDSDIDTSQFPWWQERSEQAREFVAWLLHPDPQQRPSADEALEHPWMEKHAPELPSLSGEIARSLADYARVPAVTRCCLLLVAGRLGVPDLEALGAAFLGADVDGDGTISREDLADALEGMQGSWWWNPAAQVDVDKVLEVADFDHSGGMSYTEFVAACICARYGSAEELTRQAFHALDSDRDGRVQVGEVQRLFRERDAYILQDLPQDRPFNLHEWCACVEAHRTGGARQRAGSSAHLVHRRVRSSCV